jgi:hypothetical protein
MKVKLLTKWKDKELVCCCPVINKCNKEHGCEELDFTLNPYDGIKECMGHDAYKRCNGRVQQRR